MFIRPFTILLLATTISTGAHALQIDRYTVLVSKETPEQYNELAVPINIKFPKAITNIVAAIEYLLTRSSYQLVLDYRAEILTNIALPDVHRQLGPITLKRAIEVLIGKAWALSTDPVHREIQIALKPKYQDPALNPYLAGQITTTISHNQSLEQIVKVNINKEDFAQALKKILPNGWHIDMDPLLQPAKVSIISEDLSRLAIIKKLIAQVEAVANYYPKTKILVVRTPKQKPTIEQVIR